MTLIKSIFSGTDTPRVKKVKPAAIEGRMDTGEATERERARRHKRKSSLLTRGLLSQEPDVYTPGRGTLG